MSHQPAFNFKFSRRRLLVVLGASLAGRAWAQTGTTWANIEAGARGQKVYFNAWGGSERTNA